jgi:hypothetical protein
MVLRAMSEAAEVAARLRAVQDRGVTGVAHVLDGGERVGTLVYVEASMGWEAFEVTRAGVYRNLQLSPIAGHVTDWEACARSAVPELADRIAGGSRK